MGVVSCVFLLILGVSLKEEPFLVKVSMIGLCSMYLSR